MQVRVDTSKLDNLIRFLAGMETRVADFSVPMTEVSHWMEDEIRDRIYTAGSSDGKPLAPHAEATTERWGAHALLRLSGEFASSPRRFTDKFGAGVLLGPAANLNEWGTRMPVTFGSGGLQINTRQRGQRSEGAQKNPPRPVAWTSQRVTERAMQFILDYATDQDSAA